VLRIHLLRKLIRERRGATAAEFGLVIPILTIMLFAIIKFGIVMNSYVELTNAVAAGAHQLAISRGTANSYDKTLTAMDNAAPNLNAFTKLSQNPGQAVTVKVAGTGCTSANQSGACESAFTAGGEATVSATYPCDWDIPFTNLGSCSLTTSATEYIQ